MDPFWKDIYSEDKDKRYSGLFMGVLLSLFLGLPLLALGFDSLSPLLPGFFNALTGYPDVNRFVFVCVILALGLSLAAVVLFGMRWIRFGRKAREERLKYSDLSRDELMKARSKLKNNMNPVKFRVVERPGKRPALRAPDTDLKY